MVVSLRSAQRFIRSVQKEDETLNSIPDEIFYLCILFYAVREYWDILGDKINSSPDHMTITKDELANRNFENTSYGKAVINSTSNMIVTWKFRNNCAQGHWSGFGIVSDTNCQNRDFGKQRDGYYYYAVDYRGRKFWNSQYDGRGRDRRLHTLRWDPNDVITMVVNLRDGTIQVAVSRKVSDEMERQLVFNGIKIADNVSYRLAVCLKHPHDSVTILDFFESNL